MRSHHQDMDKLNQQMARITAVAALALLTLVGCYTHEQAVEPELDLTAPSLDTRLISPPLLITLERSADWDKPVVIPTPKTSWDVVISQPEPPPAPQPTPASSQIATVAELLEEDLAGMDNLDEELERPNHPGSDAASRIEEFKTAQIDAGQIVQTNWTAGESLHGAQIPTPVLVAKGIEPGPTLCVTAAVHGDELNGIEAVRQLMYSLNPQKLKGTVIGVPIVNLQGFQRHSRYLADRRDLNRFFPGNARGSAASRMAHSFFNEVIADCDSLVDLHTGSFHRTNLPQLRANLNNSDVLALTEGFGATVILHSDGAEGTLRRAAVDAGIPAVTLEAGEPLRLQDDAVDHTVKALFTLLDTMEMYNKRSLWGNPEPTYYSSSWVRADQGGILTSSVKLGKRVREGDILGQVIDPISNEMVAIIAPHAGRVIGMSLNQFVMPGFATYHLATESPIEALGEEEHFHAESVDLAINESMRSDESE